MYPRSLPVLDNRMLKEKGFHLDLEREHYLILSRTIMVRNPEDLLRILI